MKKNELKKVENIAEQEFNYDGESNYIGSSEFDFGGTGKSFANEYGNGRSFSVVLTNTSDEDRTIAMNPAYYDTLARLAAEGHGEVVGILGDGEIYSQEAGKTIVAASLNGGKSIYGLLEFAKKNALRVVRMSMQSNVPAQFEQVITVENVSPFDKLGTQQILLSTFRSAQQFAQDKIDMDLLSRDQVLDFNDQNLIKMKIVAGATVTINMFIGAVNNPSLTLKNRATKAHSKMARR